MKQILKWFGSHSNALQGVAAFLFIIITLVALPKFFFSLTRPDIILRVNFDDTTTPVDLTQWIQEFGRIARLNENILISDEKVRQDFASVLHNPVVKKVQESLRAPDKLTVSIINQTSKPASGLRLRIDNVYSLWGIETEGDFLSPNEQTDIQNRIIQGYQDKKIIISSLPDIPPNSSLKMMLYGNLEIAKPTLNVVGYSVDLRQIIEIEDSWLINLYSNPWLLLPFMPIIFPLLYILYVILRRRRILQKTEYVLYDASCAAALKGEIDDAIVLLRQAIANGYSDLEHAKNDKDLQALHGRSDFEQIFGS